jgi:hypothetical protein
MIMTEIKLIELGFTPCAIMFPLSNVLINDELTICIEYENGKIVLYVCFRKSWKKKIVELVNLEKTLNEIIAVFPTLRIEGNSDSIRQYHDKINFSEYHTRKLTDKIFIINRHPFYCTLWDLETGGSPRKCSPDFLVVFSQKKDISSSSFKIEINEKTRQPILVFMPEGSDNKKFVSL